ncbi:YCF48-related protein [Rufibacter sp. XAAS-G3-1]|uniref:YCF48-related protein n=1 Tax=Rufibacter sp. XAAS-G3-1 TaxID=2729134 RepID=UPI0015E6F0F4|nr:YCF48-related protein [Rufibacter sp. XAAS-G3-1]
MKKILLLTLCIFSTCNLFAQWSKLNSGTTETLNCVYFTDEQIGYAAGAGATTATILKTTDGGNTWLPLVINTFNEIISLSFGNANTGYVLTKKSELFKTTNAGATWNNIKNFGAGDGQLFFHDAENGYVVNIDGTVYRTSDGGSSWTTFALTNFINPTSIYFPNLQTGYIVTYWGKVAKTTDAGKTWIVLNQATSKPLWDVFFTDSNIGYAVGGDGVSSLILKTLNGGGTWTVQTTTPSTTSNHNAVYFTDANTGYCGNTMIYKTSNGGSNWNEMATNGQIKDIFFPTKYIGYSVGYGGTILKYSTLTGTFEDNIFSKSFDVFPNPSNGLLNIKLGDQLNIKGYFLKVSNVLGEVVYELPINKHNITLSTGDIGRNGIFTVSIINSEYTTVGVKRIVIQ